MRHLTEEEYRKIWREAPNKATVSIRVLTPEGYEGYADLTRGMYFSDNLSAEEFTRALKIFLPNLLPNIKI